MSASGPESGQLNLDMGGGPVVVSDISESDINDSNADTIDDNELDFIKTRMVKRLKRETLHYSFMISMSLDFMISVLDCKCDC